MRASQRNRWKLARPQVRLGLPTEPAKLSLLWTLGSNRSTGDLQQHPASLLLLTPRRIHAGAGCVP